MRMFLGIILTLAFTANIHGSSGPFSTVGDTLGGIMLFEQSTIDLGKVKIGDHPTFQFKYTNVGNEDLQIEFISLCDCTEAEYNTDPLPPRGQDVIDVKFLSERKEINEPITLDILLANKMPDTDIPIVLTLTYTYELVN